MKNLIQNIKILKLLPDEFSDNGSILCELQNKIQNKTQILVFCEDLYNYMDKLNEESFYQAYFYVFSRPLPTDETKTNIILNQHSGLLSATGPISFFYKDYPVIDIGFPVVINIEIERSELILNSYYQIDSGLRICFENDLLNAS